MSTHQPVVAQAGAPDIAAAVRVLRAGGLVAFPTETVYGLGADASAPEAVARIYAAKGRPRFNPLIAHVATRLAAEIEGVFTREARTLAEAFWPGPLTLVLPRAPGGAVCDLARAGLDSIGLRVPSHPLALELLRGVGRPVAAPSANRSGHVSPTNATHVASDLGAMVDMILDGGPCPVGVESTIVACLDGAITMLRPGGLPIEAIEAAIGRPLESPMGAAIRAPGMLASHYAPKARLRLDATALEEGELGLDFAGSLGGASLDLSPAGDTREAAANLYGFIRRLDALAPATIAVAPIPSAGLGAAIADRLARAAAPRAPT
jgi:L-threonylcarbamoyladenylate synthase